LCASFQHACRYYEATSEWTLDYPPFFAWFEWTMSHFARLADPKMLAVSNLEYDSSATVVFQRLSVSLTGLVLAAAVLWGTRQQAHTAKGAALAFLVLCNAGLIMVDNIHFQYNSFLMGEFTLSQPTDTAPPAHCHSSKQHRANLQQQQQQQQQHIKPRCMCAAYLPASKSSRVFLTEMLPTSPPLYAGVLLWSIIAIEQQQDLLGGALFAVLLNLKHLFAYVAPVYFVYLLRHYCMGIGNGGNHTNHRQTSAAAVGSPQGKRSTVRPANSSGSAAQQWAGCLWRFAWLGGLVLAICAVAWWPFVALRQVPQVSDNRSKVLVWAAELHESKVQLVSDHSTRPCSQVLSRLFPFGRGLTHAYWAPNAWALYSAADKVLAAGLSKLGLLPPPPTGHMAGGIVGVAPFLVLPQVRLQ
jgi:alpha-1,3-glucosyltransferase